MISWMSNHYLIPNPKVGDPLNTIIRSLLRGTAFWGGDEVGHASFVASHHIFEKGEHALHGVVLCAKGPCEHHHHGVGRPMVADGAVHGIDEHAMGLNDRMII